MSELFHYGIKRRSGRYPWGSGDNPYQSERDFIGRVKDLKAQGLTELEVAKGMGLKNTSELRALYSVAREQQRASDIHQALVFHDKGMSDKAIAERLGVSEKTVYNYLQPAMQMRQDKNRTVADMLMDSVDAKNYIDVGAGVERHLGVSRTQLKTALEIAKREGYKTQYIQVEQLGTGKKTTVMVLVKEDQNWKELNANKDKISLPIEWTNDGGLTRERLRPPENVSSDRIEVRYGDKGGSEMDGVIELRRGVEDLSLGNSNYAQVRIAVDGTHYMKGMAIYSDDLPKGVDIRFNTNKATGTPIMSDDPKASQVLKSMKLENEDNPFGATITRQSGALNIVNEEGKWSDWSRSLSSQFLSKQPEALAKKQLGLSYDIRKDEFDDIMKITNPVVKQQRLEEFASECDSAAVHLKGAALPRQATHVILPVTSMSEKEIYAPNYKDGERVVLIRYPHGGKFEIPELIVNNKNPQAKSMIGNGVDAVGINHKVASQLSGADFDGDTVMVIPKKEGTAGGLIKTQRPLDQLKDYDPHEQYPGYEGMKVLKGKGLQQKMGDVSNLITDMTIKGASPEKIARAVKHSMVIIDAEKHKLNYKQSYIDNDIAALKEEFQGGANRGASTLISKASSQARVDERKEGIIVEDPLTGKRRRQYINSDTGELLYEPTGRTKQKAIRDQSGKVIGYEDTGVKVQTKTTKMAIAKDAKELLSDNPTRIELIYADHANKLKSLANQARKALVSVVPTPYSPSAKKVYQKEVDSLLSQLNEAEKNAPIERKAQIIANSKVKAIMEANPSMDADDIKKIKGQSLVDARISIGAKKKQINITDGEWKAIQAGAVSTNTLRKIIRNADPNQVKRLSTPRTSTTMTPAKIARAKSLLDQLNGPTQAQVAEMLGVSVSTLSKALNS